jgi:hypothetical protein
VGIPAAGVFWRPRDGGPKSKLVIPLDLSALMILILDDTMGTLDELGRCAGVSWNRRDEKWIATIDGDADDGKSKSRYLGSFEDEVDAALAYDQAALKRHKDKAQLNFPDLFPEPSPTSQPIPEQPGLWPSPEHAPPPPGFEGPYLDEEGLWARPTQEQPFAASRYMGEVLKIHHTPCPQPIPLHVGLEDSSIHP